MLHPGTDVIEETSTTSYSESATVNISTVGTEDRMNDNVVHMCYHHALELSYFVQQDGLFEERILVQFW